MIVWGVEKEAPSEEDYPNMYGEIRNLLPHLKAEEIAIVVLLVSTTCFGCHEAYKSCQCWNDD